MNRWCIECGASGRPALAVGVNDEGEYACVGHGGKAKEESMPVFEPKECGCGCGEMFTPTGCRSVYKLGHKPNKTRVAALPVKTAPRPPKSATVVGGPSDGISLSADQLSKVLSVLFANATSGQRRQVIEILTEG